MRYIIPKRKTRYPFVFILFFILASGYYLFHEKKPAQLAQLPAKTNGVVLEIHDGDTLSLMIDRRVYRARLIGIDAPEMGQIPWGERAKKALSTMLSGETVIVETDIERFDKYNRLLIYLFNKKGELINERMLLEGYAVLLTIPPNVKYVERFVIAEKKARQQKKGIWGRNGLKEMPAEYKKRHRDN